MSFSTSVTVQLIVCLWQALFRTSSSTLCGQLLHRQRIGDVMFYTNVANATVTSCNWTILPPQGRTDVMLVIQILHLQYYTKADRLLLPDGTSLPSNTPSRRFKSESPPSCHSYVINPTSKQAYCKSGKQIYDVCATTTQRSRSWPPVVTLRGTNVELMFVYAFMDCPVIAQNLPSIKYGEIILGVILAFSLILLLLLFVRAKFKHRQKLKRIKSGGQITDVYTIPFYESHPRMLRRKLNPKSKSSNNGARQGSTRNGELPPTPPARTDPTPQLTQTKLATGRQLPLSTPPTIPSREPGDEVPPVAHVNDSDGYYTRSVGPATATTTGEDNEEPLLETKPSSQETETTPETTPPETYIGMVGPAST